MPKELLNKEAQILIDKLTSNQQADPFDILKKLGDLAQEGDQKALGFLKNYLKAEIEAPEYLPSESPISCEFTYPNASKIGLLGFKLTIYGGELNDCDVAKYQVPGDFFSTERYTGGCCYTLEKINDEVWRNILPLKLKLNIEGLDVNALSGYFKETDPAVLNV